MSSPISDFIVWFLSWNQWILIPLFIIWQVSRILLLIFDDKDYRSDFTQALWNVYRISFKLARIEAVILFVVMLLSVLAMKYAGL